MEERLDDAIEVLKDHAGQLMPGGGPAGMAAGGGVMPTHSTELSRYMPAASVGLPGSITSLKVHSLAVLVRFSVPVSR